MNHLLVDRLPDEHAETVAEQLTIGFVDPRPTPQQVEAAKAIVREFGTPIMKALLEEIGQLRGQLTTAGIQVVVDQEQRAELFDDARRQQIDERHRRTEGRYGRD